MAEMTMGGRILGLRRSKKISQQELAEAAGISVTYLSELENDRRPSAGAGTVRDLARALEVTMDYLFDGDGVASPEERAPVRDTEPPPSVAPADFRPLPERLAQPVRAPVTKESQTRRRSK